MNAEVTFIPEKEINEKMASLGLNKCFSEAPSLPGISRFHCIEPDGEGFLTCPLYTTETATQSLTFDVYPYLESDFDDDSDNEDEAEDLDDSFNVESDQDSKGHSEERDSDDVEFVKESLKSSDENSPDDLSSANQHHITLPIIY